jgi:methylmalonyl-CoA/ethylmalonyl-CoA epimerase
VEEAATVALARDFGLGPIDQVSYVVEDLEQALPRYEALFGPFRRGDSPLRDCLYRGRRVDCRLHLAVNREGPVEIELIQVAEGEAPHLEHLKARGEGLHHVRFRVADLDGKLAELSEAGFQTVFYKRFGPTVGFAYLETPPQMGASVIELLEMP